MNKLKKILFVGILFASSGFANAQMNLTLEDAMDIALENSPEIKQSRLAMEQNRQYLNAQLAALKSNFSLNVTPIEYSNNEVFDKFNAKWYTNESIGAKGNLAVSQPIKLTDGRITLTNELAYNDEYSEGTNTGFAGFNNNLYLSYNQPLFTYNRIKLNLKRYEYTLENSTLAYSIQMLGMERQVTQALYAIYQKQKSLQISEEEFANEEISLEIIKSKVEAGLSAQEELLQAELNYFTSKSNVDNAKVDFENAKDEFKKLVGIELDNDFGIETNIDYKPVLINMDKAIENGLTQRLELTQRKIDLNNAELDLIETSANNEFRGDVDLSIGLRGNNENFANIYDKPTRTPMVGVTFAIPIFDWGARKAKIKAAELAVESKEIDIKSMEDDIVISIRKIYRNLQNQINQIKIAEQNEKNAQLTYEINLERYKNGDLTSIDLERFQNQLSQKKLDLSNALINYKLELLNMKIQSLWDFENNISFVPQEFQKNVSPKTNN